MPWLGRFSSFPVRGEGKKRAAAWPIGTKIGTYFAAECGFVCSTIRTSVRKLDEMPNRPFNTKPFLLTSTEDLFLSTSGGGGDS
ncbi:unnamed protein product [Protopolystoma xenopodis]|uniref:Uncharacterized protein n=1 Tax=Protopolystoma xenopodis TaxID=117903 RepID=A0A448WQS0_9PLAT|nr:unnamed protein product [Protopolystoma xenopodis]